jgi:Domain of unknown function (DUF4282)
VLRSGKTALFQRRKNDALAPRCDLVGEIAAAKRSRASIDRCAGEVPVCGPARESPRGFGWGMVMFGLGDLFQWERFVTPTVIKVFYWLAVVLSILLGFAGIVSSLTTMAFNPFVGMIFLIASLLGACMGVIVARIVAEFVLIVFRINEHLGAIRNQGNGMRG